MRTIADLSDHEQRALNDLRREIARRLPELRVRMTVFGSRARGDAETDSDMDILLEVETDHLAFSDKQGLRQIASEVSLTSGIILSLLVVDRQTRQARRLFPIRQHSRRRDRRVSEREIRELASKAERSLRA